MEKSVENIDINVFRQRLRDRLKVLKMSREKLAEKAGISPDTIDKWFRGKIDDINGGINPYLPSLNVIYKVSQVLGVSVDYFVNPNMDCLTVTNQQINDMIGLNDTGIAGLQAIKQSDDKQIDDGQQALCVLPVLNDMLGVCHGQGFRDILQAFRDFLKSEYIVPLYIDDSGLNVVASSKKYKGINPKALKGKRGKVGSVSYASDFYVQFFGLENDIHDNIPIAINKEFMQAVALKQLETTLINIQQDIPK